MAVVMDGVVERVRGVAVKGDDELSGLVVINRGVSFRSLSDPSIELIDVVGDLHTRQ